MKLIGIFTDCNTADILVTLLRSMNAQVRLEWQTVIMQDSSNGNLVYQDIYAIYQDPDQKLLGNEQISSSVKLPGSNVEYFLAVEEDTLELKCADSMRIYHLLQISSAGIYRFSSIDYSGLPLDNLGRLKFLGE